VLGWTALEIAPQAADPVFADASIPISVAKFVAVTDDDPYPLAPGCDAIMVADSTTGSAVERGEYQMSPGQLTTTSDASLMVSAANEYGHFVYVMKWLPDQDRWGSAFFYDRRLAGGAAVAIPPDDSTLLVPWQNAIAKYDVAGVTLMSLGPLAGLLAIGDTQSPIAGATVAADVEFSADSSTAYVVANDGYVYTLDVGSHTWLGDPIPYVVTGGTKDLRTRRTFARITLTLKAHCARERSPVHIAMVLGGSATMAGQKHQLIKQTATRLIRTLDMPTSSWTKAGVVEFNTRARRLCGLTNDEDRVIGSVNRVGANGGTRINLGIMEGLRVISQGRTGINRDELTEVMIVFSDGLNDSGCAPVLNAARQARGQGVLLLAVCVGDDCGEQCMRQVASGHRYYFRAENAVQLLAMFEPRPDPGLKILLHKLTIYDTLPDWMEYVPESADPPQSSPEDPDRWLKWEDEYVPTDGVTYTFKAKPLKTGYLPTNAEATGEIVDNKGRSGSWVFQQPRVTVLDPGGPRTPAPTATGTLSPPG
jgi:hypothetical protein